MKLPPLPLLLALAPAAAAQTTWYVDVNGTPPGSGTLNDPYTSLQYAIDQPTTLPFDQIHIFPGTYFETIDYKGKSLYVKSTDGPEVTILDAQYSGPVVRVESGEAAGTWLIGFTVTHGEGLGSFGAAVRVVGSNLSLRSCRIVENADQVGSGPVAGIYAEDSPLLIDQCYVAHNGTADVYGAAGLHVTGTSGAHSGVMASTFQDNLGGLGGAIYLGDGTLLLEASQIVANRTNNEAGAGLYVDGGTANVIACAFLDNVNHFDHYPGGAIYQSSGTLFVVASDFERNLGMRGGAIAVDGGTAQINACRFVDNVATTGQVGAGDGGAIHSFASTDVIYSLFVGNRALGGGGGGGGDGLGGALWGSFTADRCTFFGNFAANSGGATEGGTVVNSIAWRNAPDQVGPGTVVTYSDVEGGAPGTGNIADDPLLLDPSYPDFHLQQGSPCIDAGTGLEQDGTLVDMGAFPFDAGYVPDPRVYCTTKTTSQGKDPQIGWSGSPTLSGPDDFAVWANGVLPNQFGLMIWGLAAGDKPFFGGTLCLGGSFVRTPVAASGANGFLQFDFTQAYMGAKGVPAYETLYAQWWFRDNGFPPPDNVGLTGGLKFIVVP